MSTKDSIPLATVKELLQLQRDDFNGMISTLMESFNSRYDNLKTEVLEIKHSLEFSQKEIESIVKSTDNQASTTFYLKNEVVLLQEQLVEITNKLDYHENQSRRNNIRFDGVPESDRETWMDTENKIQEILKTKFDFLEPPEIERAHRVGSPKSNTPRPIVVKFNKYKDRHTVLRNGKNLKGSSMFVNEDVSDRVNARRKEQMARLKEARNEGKIAYFILDRLVIKDRSLKQNGIPDEQTCQVISANTRPVTRSQSINIHE